MNIYLNTTFAGRVERHAVGGRHFAGIREQEMPGFNFRSPGIRVLRELETDIAANTSPEFFHDVLSFFLEKVTLPLVHMHVTAVIAFVIGQGQN